MTDEKKLLISIQQDVLTVRQDIAALRESLERGGIIVSRISSGTEEEAVRTWKAPVLTKLGDMLQIIAESNPVSAAELEKQGFNTAKDVATDPEVDVKVDKDFSLDLDASVDTDPSRNAGNWLPRWLGGDTDPNMNAADKKRDKKFDPPPPDTKDDANDINPHPDTELDRVEA